jgi:predicted site-specific integrase-resolvase
MELLSTTKVAARLDVDDSTVRLWCRQGLFPSAQNVGGSWVIPASELVGFKPPAMGRPKKKATSKATKSRGKK